MFCSCITVDTVLGSHLKKGKWMTQGFDECIVPSDMNPIPDDDFRELVDQVPEGCKFTFVSDSCHSGGLIDGAKEHIGESTNKNQNQEPKAHFFELEIWNFFYSLLMKLFAFCGICSSHEEPDKIEITARYEAGKSRYLPMESFINILKEKTGKDNIEVGKIRPTLFDVFGEDASPKVKKFIKAMLTKLDQSGSVDGEIYRGGSSSGLVPDRGILLSGCQTDETSADVKKGGEAYGAFSNAIQMVLSEGGGEKDKITNKELVLRAREMLKEQGFTQRPGLYCNDRFVDDPFIC
ncbi:Metacaspase-7 [Hirschfeldia incana]|nr:Metacaspase-7 [Hirschfeldia incana]